MKKTFFLFFSIIILLLVLTMCDRFDTVTPDEWDQIVNDALATQTPTPTVDPNATPTPTVDPNATPSATVDPNATPSATVDPNVTPSATVDPNVTPSATVDPNATPTPENLISNPGFDNNLTDWTVELGGATSSVTISSGQLLIRFSDTLSEYTEAYFVQDNISLTLNSSYKFTFSARAVETRDIRVLFTDTAGNKVYSERQFTLPNTASVAEFSYEFNMYEASDSIGKMYIYFGPLGGANDLTDMYFDDFELIEIAGPAPSPSATATPTATPTATATPENVLKNSDFANGINDWIYYNGPEATTTTFNVTGGEMVVGIMGMTVTERNEIWLSQTGITLESGKSYSLTFDVRTLSAREIEIEFSDDTSVNVYKNERLNVTNASMETYTVNFDMFSATDTNARLSIYMGAINGSFVMTTMTYDNIELKEIAGPVTTLPALYAYYPFDTDFNDSTANNKHLSYNGSPSISNLESHKGGGSLFFSAGSDFLFSNAYPSSISNFTFTAWISASPDGTIFHINNNNYKLRVMNIVDNPLQGGVNNAFTDTLTDGGTIPNNTWTHVAGVWEYGGPAMSYVRVYINGQKVGEAMAATEPTSNGSIEIGRNGTASDYFDGYMDEIRVYTEALTETQIKADMIQ